MMWDVVVRWPRKLGIGFDKLINSGVPDLSSHGNNNQTHLN